MAFNEHEQKLMRYLAGAAIPADTTRGLPAADDEVIFGRLLSKATSRAAHLSPLMASVDIAPGADDKALQAWSEELVSRWTPQDAGLLTRLLPLLLQAYYEDSRVQQVYQRRPGPPFPQGYDVIQGDWSLLDGVRDRPTLYRTETR